MGGLLAAEVALIPSSSPNSPSPFRHRILGSINYDTPFLGMHPGVIRSGLNSLFRPDLSPPATPRHDALDSMSRQDSGVIPSQSQDPNFNPAFPNDIRLPVRSGWKNASHFVTKHARHIGSATQKLITSHAEFSGCLADYEGLKVRYAKIRSLEEDDVEKRKVWFRDGRPVPRVRFVNYYTASTGRPTRPFASYQSSAETPTAPAERGAGDVKFNETAEPSATELDADNLTHQNPLDDDDLDDDGSELSDLTDLDPLDDTESVFSETTTAVSSSEFVEPKAVARQDSETSSTPPIVPQSCEFLPEPAFTTDCNKNFGTLFKQHHRMIKDRVRDFKAQQKAEYLRLVREAKVTPKVNKTALKAFIESQKAERDRFYENIKTDWKQMYEQLKKDFDIKKVEQSKRQDLAKISAKQARSAERVERKLERLERKSDKRTTRRADKIERKMNKNAVKQKHDTPQDHDNQDILFESDNLGASGSTPSLLTTHSTANSDAVSSSGTSLPPYSSRSQDKGRHNSESIGYTSSSISGPEIKVKDKKFCVLPPKNEARQRDPTWIRVFMKDLDEVGAHCGLFFPVGPGEEAQPTSWSERYSWLVSDAAERVEQWVKGANQGLSQASGDGRIGAAGT